jgi:DNA-binding CsgD family transcriptional regulator
MLHGRRAEQAAVEALLLNAREGVSGAVILRGEAGIGKTAMLDYAASRAGGMQVLRSGGIESEAALPFAGLHLLLRSASNRLDALPPPQQRALSGAFGLRTGEGDRFMIGAGVLSLLADLAQDTPLLCLVDDAHWLDRASAEALLFAARRLGREGVAILFAARDYAAALDSAGVPELRLTGLDVESSAALLADAGAHLPPALRDRLVAQTRGNPLALRELAPLTTAEDVGGGPIPVTNRVRDAFHHQVSGLPAPSRSMVLLVAADESGELELLLGAADRLGLSAADLQPAEAIGLVFLQAGAVTFRHPLIRSAVYHSAAIAERIAAHRALAAACVGDHRLDRRAWHLSLATTGADDAVAALLEQAGARAVARTAHSAAAAAYERAAHLSSDRDEAARRLVLACEAGAEGGQLNWAQARVERALPDISDPLLRTRLIDIAARADHVNGALHHAHDRLTTGAELIKDSDPGHAFWMLVNALHAAWAAPTDPQLIAGPVDRFDTLDLDPDEPVTSMAWLLRWATAEVLDHDTSRYPPLDQTLLHSARRAGRAAGHRGSAQVSSFAFIAAQDSASAEVAAELVADARTHGTIFAMPLGLAQLALTQTMLGHHREALINGTEAVRISRDTGQPLWERYAHGALAYLAAIEGDDERCRRHASDAELPAGAPPGSSSGTMWADTAVALLELGQGKVTETFERLAAAQRGPTRHHSAVIRSVPDLVEAAVRLGRTDDIAAAITRYQRWAATTGQPWGAALLARCRAMLAPDDDTEQHYLQAIALHEPRSRPFERARSALLYGEWLRRARRRRDARTHLTTALHTFEQLGSTPWATRARAELGASGATVTRTAVADVFAALTPQEQQITQLAAQGMSNGDIAAQLFLSPRTVAYHLYKAYPKLGITSRTELATLTAT